MDYAENSAILAVIRLNLCYNVCMTFGTGIPLRQFSSHLRNEAVRHQLILDRVERDSIIEGLPRFTKKSRSECLKEIRKVSKR